MPTRQYLYMMSANKEGGILSTRNGRLTNSMEEEEYLLFHSRGAGMEPPALTTKVKIQPLRFLQMKSKVNAQNAAAAKKKKAMGHQTGNNFALLLISQLAVFAAYL